MSPSSPSHQTHGTMLPLVLREQGWHISNVEGRVERHVPNAFLAHRPHAQAQGDNGFVGLYHAGLAQSWEAQLDAAAIASVLTGVRWAIVANSTTFVVCDGWKRQALPNGRIAAIELFDHPRGLAMLQAPTESRGLSFPLAPKRTGEWTHWMAPLGMRAHDGDPEPHTGPTAWLDAQGDGLFVLRAGSHVAMRFAPSLCARPDALRRVLEMRAEVGLRATFDPDLLCTQQDSAPLPRSAVASLVLGREEEDVLEHAKPHLKKTRKHAT